MRDVITRCVPDAEEHFAYKMPAYKFKGKPLIYFAAFANHIGVYATPEVHKLFSKALAAYKQGKGSVQFPLNQKIPFALIKQMVCFKAQEIEREIRH